MAYVCFESHLLDVPLNSQWIDTRASIHITNLLHVFVKKESPNQDEVGLFKGNGEKEIVKWIRIVKQKLASRFFLELLILFMFHS